MPIILRTRHIEGLWGMALNDQRTPALLREKQKRHVAQNPATSSPQEFNEEKLAYIGCGVWRVRCRCKEAPHTDPEWGISCCFGCGAIWTNVTFPEDWRAIEDVLVMRPVQSHRNWEPHETLEDLVREQREHGDPIPEGIE